MTQDLSIQGRHEVVDAVEDDKMAAIPSVRNVIILFILDVLYKVLGLFAFRYYETLQRALNNCVHSRYLEHMGIIARQRQYKAYTTFLILIIRQWILIHLAAYQTLGSSFLLASSSPPSSRAVVATVARDTYTGILHFCDSHNLDHYLINLVLRCTI